MRAAAAPLYTFLVNFSEDVDGMLDEAITKQTKATAKLESKITAAAAVAAANPGGMNQDAQDAVASVRGDRQYQTCDQI